MTGHRVPVLDGIRGAAILLVILHHCFLTVPPGQDPLDTFLSGFAVSGWCGVDLFFVLSGFLITGILYDSKGRGNYFRNFYGRRTVRVFPLYYAVLLLFFIVLPRFQHPSIQEYLADSSRDQIWFWTYLTNVRIAIQGGFYGHLIPDVLWSLAIEEQFYLIWPVVVLRFGRRTLMRLCVVLIVGAFALRAGLALLDFDPIVSLVSTPARMDCLFIGAFVALLARGEVGLSKAIPLARRTVALSALALLVIGAYLGDLDRWNTLVNTVGFTLLGLLFGSTLVLCLTARGNSAWLWSLDNSPLRTLGKYSYALYLFHGPMTSLSRSYVTSNVGENPGLLRTALHIVVVMGLSMGLSLASWHLLERRFLALKAYFRTPETPRD